MMMKFFRLEIFNQMPETAFEWIERSSILVESIAVIIILFGLIFGTIRYIVLTIKKRQYTKQNFQQYKHGIAKSLLLSLEILVAADVIRTVALEPTLNNILGLGLLVVIRTFLSWSLMVEMEGHWPWEAKPTED